ncbi:MAG TPA: heparan-alpha-glucosaminide N-acetyltransferase domain-containing protein [Dyella sp.]|uniref:acyltransferase family protein n=1 Tax=Dyella sp. TaxID=1869338 RepID=UPI002D768B41|nr:heparan-alpha-glucosaminide N-acetyltransferase domain-containing protein [Dyella sp.]HET6555015.1 heparan-alpha-glucosaminide N-acetyltransferase domain-containing protein [Dyella sp.]
MLRRLGSVDALRGCTVALMLLVNDPGDGEHVYWPLVHAQWHGCTPTDLMFPFFLFVVGVSIALAIGPRVERGEDKGALTRAAMMRASRILLLGVAINVLAWLAMPEAHLRFPGVLQRIGVCFAGAAWFAIYSSVRAQWAAIVAILLGYWALLLAGGTLEPFVNIVDRVDFAIFGHAVYQTDPITGRGHDPEGLLGCFPSLATSLLGLRAGQWLRDGKVKALLTMSVLLLVLGGAWSLVFPLNKNLWTSSFVLWTGGLAMLALVLFHLLVDRGEWPAVGRRFGMNAVAAYAGSELMQILMPALGIQQPLYQHAFAGWITPLAGPYIASLAYALAFVAVWWLIVVALDRRKIHLKL